MKTGTTSACALAALLAALAFDASAGEDTGLYLGGGIGRSYIEADGKIVTVSEEFQYGVDDDDSGYKLFAGWKFSPYLAVEGGYVDFGNTSGTTDDSIAEASAEGWGAFVVGQLPLGPVDLFAKLGFMSYEAELRVYPDGSDESFNADDSDEDWAGGFGAAWNLGSFAVRGEFELFSVSGLDELYLLSIGGTYQF